MKYIILLGDGMADYPVESLGGRTPLEAAHKPNIDSLAKKGVAGLLRTIPSGMGAGSDVANLSILGYDPKQCYTGRGPLEAASIGVRLKRGEMAFRCNLITERDGRILDYSAGHISNPEAADLVRALNRELPLGRFYPGLSYRNLFITDFIPDIETSPPHDVIGGLINEHLPRPENDEGVREINQMILGSKKILERHQVNIIRIEKGLYPANMIWLWGQGTAPQLEPFSSKYGVKAAVVSAVDIIRGIGTYAGMELADVPNATGLIDTNWEGKADHALSALDRVDLVYVHVEAIDEASHAGDAELKVRAIEEFDKRLVGRLIDKINFECRIAILPDHYTPTSIKTHTSDAVPFVITNLGGKVDGLTEYSEKEVKERGSLGTSEGHHFMDLFLKGCLPRP